MQQSGNLNYLKLYEELNGEQWAHKLNNGEENDTRKGINAHLLLYVSAKIFKGIWHNLPSFSENIHQLPSKSLK